jgi:hypothetical protein
MGRINRKIELTANILIIVVAVLLVGVIAQRYFFLPSINPNQPARVYPTIGTKINIPDTDWSNQPKTLLMVLQKDCHFCTESAPFYKRLRGKRAGQNRQFDCGLARQPRGKRGLPRSTWPL